MLSTANGKLISLEDEQIEKLTSKHDFYIDSMIPAGTYPDQDEDIQTTSIQNFMIADASKPGDIA